MNIETPKVKTTKETQSSQKSNNANNKDSSVKFSDELKNIKETDKSTQNVKNDTTQNNSEQINQDNKINSLTQENKPNDIQKQVQDKNFSDNKIEINTEKNDLYSTDSIINNVSKNMLNNMSNNLTENEQDLENIDNKNMFNGISNNLAENEQDLENIGNKNPINLGNVQNEIINNKNRFKDISNKLTEDEPDLEVIDNKNPINLDNTQNETIDNKKVDNALNGLNNIVEEMNKPNLINQQYEKFENQFKQNTNSDDKKDEVEELINNDFNIQEKNKEQLPQMNLNMNFSGDGQPFASFMNNNQDSKQEKKLVLSDKDLKEEAEILSTMAENVSIAKKVQQTQAIEDSVEQTEEIPKQKTVEREDGVKILDVKSGVTIETVVKYDNIIMNEADVEVFTNLVQNGGVNINNLAPQSAEKSVHVSKTLADMLAKAQETNQPLRIDFDNNISVIIRISRDGKISADFLPSSQIAETYLKENLPLLRQQFDDNNIQYDELNQREQRNRERDNRRKGKNNE